MSSTTGGDEKVVAFRPTEITPEERARRLQVEVERLARQSTVEWMFWLDGVAEQHGIDKGGRKPAKRSFPIRSSRRWSSWSSSNPWATLRSKGSTHRRGCGA
jgi:hypothetical protein